MACSCVSVVFSDLCSSILLLPKHRSSALPQLFSCVAARSRVADLIDCRTMGGGEKGVELVAGGRERKRVRPLFCGDGSDLLHRIRVEHVHDPWVPNGHVEAVAYAIEEHNIR